MPRGRPAKEPRLDLTQKDGRPAVWSILWHDGERQRTRSTGTSDRGQADQIFARWLLDQQDEQRGLPRSPRYPHEATISELLDAYAKARANEIRFPERLGYAIQRLVPRWSDRTVDAVRPETCKAYRDARLSDGVSIATVTRELIVLRAALIWAAKNGRLTSAPFVWTPGKQPGKDRFLTRDEAARLLCAARQEPKSRLHLPLFILLGLYTGARSEALLTLRWFPQVKFEQGERGVIDFNPPGREVTPNKKRAIVPITRHLLTFLQYAQRRTNSPFVLNYRGEPIKRIVKGFRNACKRAGLDDVTPHTLRHTCGTWLAQQGVDLWQIAGWLGHSHQETVELYAHHHPSHLRAASDALDGRRNAR
jgi:integrase